SDDVAPPPNPAVSQEENKILQDIKTQGGDYDVDDDGTVVSITCDGLPIKDADLARLRSFPKLQSLRLASTQITDAGLEHLKAFPGLQALDLSGTKITDKGLASVKLLKQLQFLNLTGTKITAKGLQDLRKALPRTTITR
ncbi:MAG TPA: hypothetical protein VGY58_20350, partial [Gemmataceae bacterium]|nr:hypothetical protein [Gemmataceae bacterium]